MDSKLTDLVDVAAAEGQRIRLEYRRRERLLPPNLYAPWQPAAALAASTRRRVAAAMLQHASAFPKKGDPCLEVGYGCLGWLGDLIMWGIPDRCLHGIELDPVRAKQAQEILPAADLRVGDACQLPYPSDHFRLVIASTVFTSILNTQVRHRVAGEITRVIAPTGALLWYDFAVNNPRNAQVRKVDRQELRALFPQLQGKIRSVTLAPPLARWVAPWSWTCATLLEAIPWLRTHLLAVLLKAS